MGINVRQFYRWFTGEVRIPPMAMVALKFVRLQCGLPVRMTGAEWIEGPKKPEA